MTQENTDGQLAPSGDARPESPSAPPFNVAPEPWSLLDLLFFAIFFFAALLATGFLGLAGFTLLRPALGLHGSAQAMSKNTFFLLGVQVVFYALVFGYVYFLVVRRYRLKFWEGIKWGPLTRRQAEQYIAGGIVMTIGIQLLPAFLPDKSHFPLEKLFSTPGASYAIALFAVLVAPFMEELIFRGVLFSIFEARAGVVFAVVATAVLFAAMHIPEYSGAWDHVFLIFVVGLVLSLTRGIAKTLAPSVILHVTYNGCLMIGFFFATSHFRMMQGLLGK